VTNTKNDQVKISVLKPRPEIDRDSKSKETFLQFERLLSELRKRELPDEIVSVINSDLDEINSIADSEKTFRKKVREKQSLIIRTLEKKQKIVPRNYYRNIWLAIGMAVFGIPLGVVFGISLDNMAFIGIGLPIGLAIGIGIGAEMDKKAFREGRQLDIEIKN
jgi:hypothetical protein